MSSSPAEAPITVLQFGNDASSVRGGIAAVIRQHLANDDARLSVSAVPTYDPSATGHRGRNAPFARALRQALTRRREGVVAHVHVSQGGSLLREGLLAALLRLRRFPVVVTLHGSSSLTNGRVRFLLTGLVLRCADVAHFLSDAHRDRYARLAGRHVVIPNAVEVAPPSEAAKRPDVVFAGVVGPRKGVDLLLTAWESVPSGDWCLHLYGPPDGDFVVPDDLPGVVVHGEVAPAVVQEALAAAAVAVLPSREEAFPMFLLEAMAHRCAVVATDVGGVRELVGDGGVVVPADDAEALGKELTRLIGEPDRRAELAAAAQHRIQERFDAALVRGRWAAVYASMSRRVPATGEETAGV